MTQNISAGLSTLVGDSLAFNALENFTYSTATVKVEIVRGTDGHFSERHTPVTPFIQGTISDSGDLDTGKLSGKRFDVVQLSLLNVKKIKLNKAVQVMATEPNADLGTLEVRFEGTAAPDEDLAS